MKKKKANRSLVAANAPTVPPEPLTVEQLAWLIRDTIVPGPTREALDLALGVAKLVMCRWCAENADIQPVLIGGEVIGWKCVCADPACGWQGPMHKSRLMAWKEEQEQ